MLAARMGAFVAAAGLLLACGSEDTSSSNGGGATTTSDGAGGQGAGSGGGGSGGSGGAIAPLEDIIEVAAGSNPALAVDAAGRVHVTYDGNGGVRYCLLTARDSGCALDELLGPGGDSRVATDSAGRAHVCWVEYHNSATTFVNYAVVDGSTVTSAQIEAEDYHRRCRLDMTPDDRGVLFYQHQDTAATPEPGDVRMRLVSYSAGAIQPGPAVVVALDDPAKDVRVGGVVVDADGNAHFLYRRHDAVETRGLYYRRYETIAETFTGDELWVAGQSSDLADITLSLDDLPYVMGQQGGSLGLWYLPGTTNPLTGFAAELLQGNPAVSQVEDGDYLNVELEFDRLGRQFLTFCGAGQTDPTVEVAYYLSTEPGQDFGADAQPLRLTPGADVEQGTKDANPVPAPAPNEGVLVVWGEAGQVRLMGLGGAGF